MLHSFNRGAVLVRRASTRYSSSTYISVRLGNPLKAFASSWASLFVSRDLNVSEKHGQHQTISPPLFVETLHLTSAFEGQAAWLEISLCRHWPELTILTS
jgi:hypothetical protein